MDALEKQTTSLPSFVNLSDPKILINYLDPNYQDKIHLDKATSISKSIYEANTRSIAYVSYGLCFPMNPEILAYAMKQAKDATVLEISGASGENAILLAFAGAKHVYLNDIDPTEIRQFEKIKASLPSDVSDKLESLPGDCFDLLKNKPELAKSVYLILCRNLIHFFTDAQQAEFFLLIKNLLKPNGTAIFIANSVYYDPNLETICAQNPEATRFKTTQGLVTDYTKGTMPCFIFYKELLPFYEDLSCSGYTDYRLYQRDDKTQYKWQVNNTEFKKLDPTLQRSINKAFQKEKSTISKIPLGSVRILVNQLRVYSLETFPTVFKNNGFEVDKTFVVSYTGHLRESNNHFVKVSQNRADWSQLVGAIVRLPN